MSLTLFPIISETLRLTFLRLRADCDVENVDMTGKQEVIGLPIDVSPATLWLVIRRSVESTR